MNNYFDIAMRITKKSNENLIEILKRQLPDKGEKYIDDLKKELTIENNLYISLNKEYKSGRDLSEVGVTEETVKAFNMKYPLYMHQENAIKSISNGKNTVISTGTGSGKTESFLIPIVDYCIKHQNEKGVKAIIIYPMNALANDQKRRISEVLENTNLKFAIFTGDTKSKYASNDKKTEEYMKSLENIDDIEKYYEEYSHNEDYYEDYDEIENTEDKLDNENNVMEYKNQIIYREDIVEELPDIVITNYVMLDRILTNKKYYPLITNSINTIKFLVLDEVHIYRGNKGAHLKFLLDRVRYTIGKEDLVHIACSATLSHSDESKSTSGYLKGDASDIDKFLNPLFDSYDYNLVEAEYKEMNELDKNIDRYDEIKLLRKELFNRSMSLDDIADFLNKENKKNSFIFNNGKRYDKVAVIRLLKKSTEAVSFRTNIFMRTRKGTVKRCIDCGKYHISNDYRCNSCNSFLFEVDADDYNALIGYVKNKQLTPDSDIGGIRVGIVKRKYSYRDNERHFYMDSKKLLFDEKGLANIEVSKNPEGKDLKLVYLKKGANVIKIEEDNTFLKILKTVLKYNETFDEKYDYNKKVLTFIDSRKRVSKEKTLFNDSCIKETFSETLKFIANRDDYISLDEVLTNIYKRVKNYVEENKKDDLVNKLDVFDDFGIWLMNDIGRYPIRMNSDFNDLNSKEKDLIEFLIEERALYIERVNYKRPKYLKYRLKKEGQIKLVFTEVGVPKNKLYEKISLSSRGRNIKEFLVKRNRKIDEYDFNELLENLYEKRYLEKFKIEIENGKEKTAKTVDAYSLRGDRIEVFIGKTKYKNLRQILKYNLFIAETHSAEVDKEDKKIIENKFQIGEIDAMFSTPTLEMGIDIGGLNMVFMKGVPPLPSNFAQRAGRAGRSSDKTALIVTVCNQKSKHDEYYFQNALEMIEGVINPPRFQQDNMALAEKHMNALIYQIGINDKEKIKIILKETFKTILKEEIDDYINNFNKKNKDKNDNDLTIDSLINYKVSHELYENNTFPDYSFRRDELNVYDEKALLHQEKIKKNYKLDNYKLSSREPEMAYKEYVPGLTTYMSGKAMKISEKGEYELSKKGAKIYKENYAKEDLGNKEVLKEKDFEKFATNERISYSEEEKKNKKVIQVFYRDNVELEFENIGIVTNQGIEEFKEEGSEKPFKIAQIINRHALIIKWEPEILKFEDVVSFVAILDSAIKTMYGLDNDEIKMVHHKDSDSKEFESAVIALYDTNGNKNIDLKKIEKNLYEIIEFGIRTTEKCKCKAKSGCYSCIRSYNTNKYAATLSKKTGCDIAKYINGHCNLPTNIKEDKEKINYYDISVILKQEDKDFKVEYNGKVIMDTVEKENDSDEKKNQNEIIFNLLLRAIDEIDKDYVRIKTGVEYVKKAINGEASINIGAERFGEFMFESLKFEQIFAEKE